MGVRLCLKGAVWRIARRVSERCVWTCGCGGELRELGRVWMWVCLNGGVRVWVWVCLKGVVWVMGECRKRSVDICLSLCGCKYR